MARDSQSRDEFYLLISKAGAASSRGHFSDALEQLDHAIDIAARLTNHEMLLASRHKANMLLALGKYDECESIVTSLLRFEDNSPRENGGLFKLLGTVAFRKGSKNKAFLHYCKALELVEEDIDATRDELADVLSSFGKYYHRMQQYRKAEEMFFKSIELYKSAGSSRQLANEKVSLAGTYIRLGKLDQAQELLEEASNFYDEQDEVYYHDLRNSLHTKAVLLSYRDDYEGAREIWQLLVKRLELMLGSEHIELAPFQCNLGHAFMNLNDPENAEKCFERAVRIIEVNTEPRSHKLIAYLRDYADCLKSLNKPWEAILLEERIREIEFVVDDIL